MTIGTIRRESTQLGGSLVSDLRPTHLGIHDREQAHNHVVPLAARRSSNADNPKGYRRYADPWLCAPPLQTVCLCLGSKADR